jgi:hypothetical protein
MQLCAGTSKDFIGDATRNATARAILRFLVLWNLPQSRSEANWSTLLLSSNSRNHLADYSFLTRNVREIKVDLTIREVVWASIS